MTISYQYGVQDVISQVVEITYDELVSGVSKNLIKLPAGSTLLGGTYWVLTAFNSGTSDTATVAYNGLTLVTDATPMAAVRTDFTMPTTTNPDNVSVSTPTWVTITWTGAGTAATAGKLRVLVQYIIKGRSFAVEK